MPKHSPRCVGRACQYPPSIQLPTSVALSKNLYNSVNEKFGSLTRHFVAFGLAGLALGVGYPKRLWVIAAVIVGSSFGLEAMQLLTPDRHGRILDAMVKALGGCVGVWVSQIGTIILQSKPGRTS